MNLFVRDLRTGDKLGDGRTVTAAPVTNGAWPAYWVRFDDGDTVSLAADQLVRVTSRVVDGLGLSSLWAGMDAARVDCGQGRPRAGRYRHGRGVSSDG